MSTPASRWLFDDPTGHGFAFADKCGLVDCGTSGAGGIEFNQFGRTRLTSCVGRENAIFFHVLPPFRF
jgi:hypothetical protein